MSTKSTDTIECKECGEEYETIHKHLKTHGMSVAEYKAMYGENAPIVSQSFREKAGRPIKSKSNGGKTTTLSSFDESESSEEATESVFDKDLDTMTIDEISYYKNRLEEELDRINSRLKEI